MNLIVLRTDENMGVTDELSECMCASTRIDALESGRRSIEFAEECRERVDCAGAYPGVATIHESRRQRLRSPYRIESEQPPEPRERQRTSRVGLVAMGALPSDCLPVTLAARLAHDMQHLVEMVCPTRPRLVRESTWPGLQFSEQARSEKPLEVACRVDQVLKDR